MMQASASVERPWLIAIDPGKKSGIGVACDGVIHAHQTKFDLGAHLEGSIRSAASSHGLRVSDLVCAAVEDQHVRFARQAVAVAQIAGAWMQALAIVAPMTRVVILDPSDWRKIGGVGMSKAATLEAARQLVADGALVDHSDGSEDALEAAMMVRSLARIVRF